MTETGEAHVEFMAKLTGNTKGTHIATLGATFGAIGSIAGSCSIQVHRIHCSVST